MTKKTFVLDTNILLADANAIFSFKENNIVLPFIVLEELDKHKNSPGQLGLNARETSRKLNELLKNSSKRQSMNKGMTLPSGGKLRIVSSEPFISELNEDTVDDKADNHILAVCLGLKTEKATLVTNDILLRVKASAYNLPNEDYQNAQAIDNVENIYTGYNELEVNAVEISELWKNARNEEFLKQFIDEKQKETKKEKGGRKEIKSNKLKDIKPNEFIHIANNRSSKTFVIKNKAGRAEHVRTNRTLTNLSPRNLEQNLAFDLLLDPEINLVTIVGKAGSGKTLLSLAAGLEQVLETKQYKSLLVCRPVQPLGKDIGFLPGSLEEKLEPWIAPIKDNLKFLLPNSSGKNSKDNDQNLNYFFDRGIIEVEAMTYIRGRSIADAYMIIDEAQNLSAHELKTIITRAGEGTKIVLTGDIEQIDNLYVDSVTNGLAIAVEKFKDFDISGHILLKKGVRSKLATIGAEIL